MIGDPVLILALAFRDAERLARMLNIPRPGWKFISSETDLCGTDKPTVLIYGAAWERRDYAEVYDRARANNAQIIKLEER